MTRSRALSKAPVRRSPELVRWISRARWSAAFRRLSTKSSCTSLSISLTVPACDSLIRVARTLIGSPGSILRNIIIAVAEPLGESEAETLAMLSATASARAPK